MALLQRSKLVARPFQWFAAAACAAALLGESASAHFAWLSLRGHNGGELHAHFSEGRFDDTVEGLGEALYRTEYRTEAGPLSLDGAERLGADAGFRMQLPAQAEGGHPSLVAGSMLYGIFGRGGPPSLLSYDAKGARSLQDANRDMGLELEVFASREGDELVLRVELNDRPLAGSEVVVMEGARGSENRFESDENGLVRMPFPLSPVFSVRARSREEAKGEHEGKPYERKLRYSTLCVERMSDVAIPEGTDYEAWIRLNEADVRRAKTGADVFGMKGSATMRMEGERVPISFVYLGGQLEVLEVEGLDEAHEALIRDAIVGSLDAVRFGSRYHPPSATATVSKHLGEGAIVVEVKNKGKATLVTLREHSVREIRATHAGGSRLTRISAYETADSGLRLPSVEVQVDRDGDGNVTAIREIERAFTQVSGVPVPESVHIADLGSGSSTRHSITFKDVELVQ
ncbi:MAG: hypothetical protein AAGG01_08195 [Planctomycetota bacterium]